jgi:hypothetical protein
MPVFSCVEWLKVGNYLSHQKYRVGSMKTNFSGGEERLLFVASPRD